MPDKKKTDQWDKISKDESNRNYVLGEHMGNPFNNAENPNWRNQMLEVGYKPSMLDDPQRIQASNKVEDNNSNEELLKDYPINPS